MASKIFLSLKKYASWHASAKIIKEKQQKILKTTVLTLWLDTALKKDPKYIEWAIKERRSEPLVYKIMLNYKAKHFQERIQT